jgi:hypothetical protein
VGRGSRAGGGDNLGILTNLTNEFISMGGCESLELWGHANTDK